MEWKNLLRGFAMGTTDLIPGVSGGTLAVVLGIYYRLLEAISGLFGKDWKRHWGFLIPLGIGMVTAIVSLSRVIEYLLEHHFEPTQFFFTGLILGVLPMLIRQADVRRNFGAKHVIVLLVGLLLMASMAFLSGDKDAGPQTSLTLWSTVGFFFAGWMASTAMLLPGISGSFVLLIIGVYPTAINALSTFNLPIIFTIGFGVIIGFFVSSRAIRYLLATYPRMTYAVMIGLITGSVFVIFPGFVSGIGTILICGVAFLAGLALAMYFGSVKRMPAESA